MLDDVAALLWALGVKAYSTDALLVLTCEAVEEQLCNLTNLSAVPDGLHTMAVEMAAGKYLRALKNAGKLDGFDLDTAAVKSIQEGDTNISYAIGEGSTTPEQRLDALITALTSPRLNEIYRYRRLVW